MSSRTNFKRCVVIVNPASTHAGRVKSRIAALRKLFPQNAFHIIETSPDGKEVSRRLLLDRARLLGPSTLLCIAAGDGTINTVAECLLLHPDMPVTARRSVLLPLWGGNANDLAHMLNGWGLRWSMPGLLARAKPVTVHPLLCTLHYANKKTQTLLALNYISFGATALATQRIAEPAHRNHPLRRLHLSRYPFEFATVARAFLDEQGFSFIENGKKKSVRELVIANGPRMAKTNILPTLLVDPSFYMHTLDDMHLHAIVPSLLRSRQNPEVMRTDTTFTVTTPTLAQLDGELTKIPAHTSVHIKPAAKPLLFLSTKLAVTPGQM